MQKSGKFFNTIRHSVHIYEIQASNCLNNLKTLWTIEYCTNNPENVRLIQKLYIHGPSRKCLNNQMLSRQSRKCPANLPVRNFFSDSEQFFLVFQFHLSIEVWVRPISPGGPVKAILPDSPPDGGHLQYQLHKSQLLLRNTKLHITAPVHISFIHGIPQLLWIFLGPWVFRTGLDVCIKWIWSGLVWSGPPSAALPPRKIRAHTLSNG